MQRLRILVISETALRDEGLRTLSELVWLEELNIEDTAVSEDGIRWLRNVMPSVKIQDDLECLKACYSDESDSGDVSDVDYASGDNNDFYDSNNENDVSADSANDIGSDDSDNDTVSDDSDMIGYYHK